MAAGPFLHEPPPAPADTLRVARVLAATAAEGPGLRTAVWVQGCAVRCPGCFNPHLWTPRGGQVVRVDQWLPAVLDGAAAAGAEGVSLLGGEPFEQAAPLAALAQAFQDAGLSVMVFTGHHLEDLTRWGGRRSDIRALLERTDLLADGPYLRGQPDHARPWVGSTNQRLHLLTGRYRAADLRAPDRVQVTVSASGEVAVNGWAGTDALDALLEGIRRDG